jgi:effector-binding domain-containing protein
MKSVQLMKIVFLIIAVAAMPIHAFSQEKADACSTLKFEVKEVKGQKAVVVKMTIASSEVGPKMGEAYGKLFGYLGQNKIQPAGAPFAVYLEFNPAGNTTFEAGVPVTSPIETQGDFIYREYPTMKVLSTLYTGAYEKMAPVYEAIEKYMKDKGLQSTNIAWEIYLTDPKQVKDPGENQTIIYFPLK